MVVNGKKERSAFAGDFHRLILAKIIISAEVNLCNLIKKFFDFFGHKVVQNLYQWDWKMAIYKQICSQILCNVTA
jgi:hypothetical protein